MTIPPAATPDTDTRDTGTLDSDTHRVVHRFIDRLFAGDLPGVAALFAPEVDWRLSWPDEQLQGSIPWIRARRTPEDVQEHFLALAAHNVPHAGGTVITHRLVDGADAALLGTLHNVLRGAEKPYRVHFALHLTVQNGRITRYHIYEDSLAVFQAWHARSAAQIR